MDKFSTALSGQVRRSHYRLSLSAQTFDSAAKYPTFHPSLLGGRSKRDLASIAGQLRLDAFTFVWWDLSTHVFALFTWSDTLRMVRCVLNTISSLPSFMVIQIRLSVAGKRPGIQWLSSDALDDS